jgi:hypothetical protein
MKSTTAGAAMALSLLLAACGSAENTRADQIATEGSPAASPTSPGPSPTATLSAADQRFTAVYRASLAAKGQQSTATQAQMVSVGESVCSALSAGAAQSAVLAVDGGDKAIIRDSEKYLCPAYYPKVLIRFSGSGIAHSRPFIVPTGTVTVKYTYNCASFGAPGSFIADLETGNQASLGSDDQPIANDLGTAGKRTTTVYPQNTGAEYHVAVNSECSWSLVVAGPA